MNKPHAVTHDNTSLYGGNLGTLSNDKYGQNLYGQSKYGVPSLVLYATLIFGTGSIGIIGEGGKVLTEPELRETLIYNESLKQTIQSNSEQLTEIKQIMGLNIIELAAILHVSRPTIYAWLESAKEIRSNNQTRIEALYRIAKIWKAKGVHQIGGWLHKNLGEQKRSLFDLLKEKTLDTKEIDTHLEVISQAVLQKKQETKVFEDVLKKHNFEPVSQEEMNDRLNDIQFLD